jgi:autotransporter-associated beta strand protein
MLAAGSALATDGSWSNTSGGNWNSGANWTDGNIASGIGASAFFTNGTAVTVIQDFGSLTLGNFYFANANTQITNNTITLNGGGASVITVEGLGTTADLSVQLAGTGGSLTKNGAGTLQLNRYAYGLSGFTINGGLVYCGFPGNSDGLNVGTGTITINNGATFKFGSANQVNNYAVIDVKNGGVFDVNGQTDNIGAITGDGVVTNAGSVLNFRLNGLPRVFSGTIYGNANFNFAEPGGSVVAAGSNSLENVSFNLYSPGLLAFAPGVGTYYLGSLNTTNAQTLALQDTGGGAITLGLGKNNADMTPSVVFGGAGGLEKLGNGVLTLTNAHSYSGTTRVSGGTLRLGDGVRDCALTNSSSITANATVAFNTVTNQTYANPIYGAGTITKAGAGSLSINNLQMRPGVVTANANSSTLAINGGNSSGVTFTVNSGSALQINGGNFLMGGFTLNTGSSPLSFTGGSSTGATLVANNGTSVEVSGGTHLFASPLGGNNKNNRFTQTGGTVYFENSQGMGNTNVVHAFVSGGTFNIGTVQPPRGLGLLASGNAIVKIAAQQRIASDGWSHSLIITNNADVTSSQTLQFMSVSTTLSSTGIVALAGGTLTVSGLGNGEANAISPVFVYFNGGLLRFSASTTVGANPYTTFNVMEGGARIDGGSAQTQINQPLMNGTGGADGGLTKYGANVLVLSTNAFYTGQTTVKAGTLRTTSFSGAPFGNGNIFLDGATLQANPAGSGLTVSLTAADGAVGNTLTYGSGPSTLGLSKGSDSSVTLTLGNSGAAANSVLVRTNRGVMAIIPASGTATLGSTEKLLVNSGVTTVNNMAASVFGVHNDDRRSCDFLTYGANGFQVATYTDGLGGGATSIANVTANTAANSTQVHALRVHNGAVLTINSGQTLTVGDGVNPAGVIINNSSSTKAGITGGTLDFGTSEGIVTFNLRQSNQFAQPINSVIAGQNGMTFAGGGVDQDLSLGATNTYTGATRIMAGCVSPTTANGFSTGDIFIHGNEGGGGQFKFAFTGTMTNALHLSGVGGTPSGVPGGAVRFDANGTLSGPVELMADTRVGTPAVTAVGTFSGSITGPYGLEIGYPGQAWGKVLFSGVNTYSGTTRVSAGTLEIGAGGTLGTGPVINNATLAFSNTGNMTVTNPISGTGRVMKNGNGTLTLSGTASYSGATEVNAGTLVIGSSSFNAGTLSLTGTLDLGGQSLTIGRIGGAGTVSNTVGGAVTLTVGANNADSQYWGAIRDGAGTMALNKTGSGTLALSGLSTYSGATVISGGTIKLQGLQTSAPTNGLSYQLDASDATKLTLSGSNVTTWADSTAAGVTFTQSLAHLQPVYVTNAINGFGAIRFNGLMTNRMVAAKSALAQTVFVVNKMTGYMGNAGLWGYAANDTGIRAVSSTRWQLTGDNNDFTQGGEMYINGVAANTFAANTPHLLTAVSASQRNWSTAIGDYWGNPAQHRSYTGDIGEILVYSSILSTSDRLVVEQYLANKWMGLSVMVPTNVLPTATALVISNNAAFDLNGIQQAVGSLSGSGSVVNSSGAWSALTVGNDNTSTLFSGVISGSNALVKVGSGTLSLGGANIYFGNTLVSTGMLRLEGGANRLPTAGTVMVAAGATLDLNGQAQSLAVIGGSGSVIGGSLTVTGTVAPGGYDTIGTLTLANTPALSGSTLLIDTRSNGTSDKLAVSSSLSLTGLTLQIADIAQMSGYSYEIATCTGDLTGTFIATPNLPSTWVVRYDRTPGASKVMLIHNLGTIISFR